LAVDPAVSRLLLGGAAVMLRLLVEAEVDAALFEDVAGLIEDQAAVSVVWRDGREPIAGRMVGAVPVDEPEPRRATPHVPVVPDLMAELERSLHGPGFRQ
jgi:hypothetical protein